MSEDENVNDPRNDLLNLDSEIRKPLQRRSSYYDNDSFVEPWDYSQQNFLQLSPKLREEPEVKKAKQIKIKMPQTRAQTRQKSLDTQSVQFTVLVGERVNSCHAQFQDFGMKSQNQVYQKIVQKILTTGKKQNKNKQITIKVPTTQINTKQVIQIKQKVPFQWSDYYKFIQKNHNQVPQVKNFQPNVTGYNMNKSLYNQQRPERDSIFKNFRLKQTKTIV